MNPTGSTTTLDSWLSRMEKLSPREIVLGLDRVNAVLGRLGLGRPSKVFHVGGTNGKGSSVAMLEALCLEAGESTGSYTSPHVRHYNERIRVNGVAARDDTIVAAFERVEAAREGVPLTYFEYGTLAALVVFREHALETVILEVGMGGRLDAVNAVEPDAGIITNVSLDHCDWLGEDIETIAAEKAGIMRPSKPVVFGSCDCPQAILRAAERLGADLRVAGRDFSHRPGAADRWSWTGARIQLDRLARPSLAGDIQMQNGAAVLALLEAAGGEALLDRKRVNKAWAQLELPGRMHRLAAGREWLLDVAHNGAAASVLAAQLHRDTAHGMTAIVGVLDDKDVAGIVQPLAPLVQRWIAVTADAARAIPATELARQVANTTGRPCLVADTVAAAIEIAAARTSPEVPVLITGSFYVVGPALDELYSRREA